MSESVLVVRGLTKAFGGTCALDGVDLDVAAGEVHSVLGENGAGKSTLMKILSGSIQPDDGRVELVGQVHAPRSPDQARRAGVAIVPQEPELAPHLTVEENVVLGAEPTSWGFVRRAEMRERATRALAQVAHGGERIDPGRRASTLSPSERQRVVIARALAVAAPRVLILDEPTSSLTAADVEQLFAVIERLKGTGLSVLYVSHFLEEVMRIADRYTVLRDGRFAGTGAVAEATSDDLVRLMAGAVVERRQRRARAKAGDVVLSVRGLAGRPLPVEASFELRAGEVLGIAGLVGAGRTELLRAVFGLDAVTSGQVRVRAHAGPASPVRRLSQGVGLLSEDRKGEGLAGQLTIAENLTLSRRLGWGPFVSPARERRAAERFVEQLGIRCRDVGQRMTELSGGNQQKVALARLLHHDVDVLLLDEPTRGIDVRSRADVHASIDELVGRGKAVLVVSSYLPELFGVCDRIAVMCRGRLGEARPVGEMDEHSVLREAAGA